jgi:hypothetical protein
MPDYYPLIARAVSRLPSNKAAARQTLLHSRVLPLLCVMLLFSSCPGSALDEANRFIEIPSDIEITAFDLSTVQVIQPGRFAVINTSIARPDIMKFKLKVLDTMRDYCARADGKYAAPADILTLGQPDLPVESIDVKSRQSQLAGKTYPFKLVSWNYPYKRLALKFQGNLQPQLGVLTCKQWSQTEDQLYQEHRTLIMNGIRSKYLFDCKRGLTGLFIHEDDDPAKVITFFVSQHTDLYTFYLAVCSRVMHEVPYLPE